MNSSRLKRITAFIIGFLLYSSIYATNYYVSSDGSDANNGISNATPFKTLSYAIFVAVSGDTIYIASGHYISGTTISISSSKKGIAIMGVFISPEDRPIIDFSAMSTSSSNYGIYLKTDSCYLYGIRIKGAGDNGLLISAGNDNVIEFCDFFENQDSGVQLKSGAMRNKFINCDSYYNVDPGQGNADGFADKLDEGGFNSFRGCRAFLNSDDGWDGLPKDQTYYPTDTIINCWCYKNGYLKDGSASVGNGNGFKLGGNSLIHRQVVMNCLSALNRAKGFDYNNNVGSMTLYNCTGFGNGGIGNFAFPNNVASGEVLVLKNCLSYDASYGNIYSGATQVTNSWMSPFSVSSADFKSTDASQMLLPRKSDGSLPDITFMHLVSGSDLIDGGTDVGLPYNGSGPDLGCFETGTSVTIPLTVSITSPYDGAGYTAPANFTINASAITGTGSITSVEFYNESTLLGSDNSAPYSFTWSGVAVGIYKITAKAYDDQSGIVESDSVTVTVSNNQPSVISIISPSDNSTINATSVTIYVTTTDPDGSVSKVDYYDGTTFLGTVSAVAPPYNYVWNSPSAGTHQISVKVTDSNGGVTTSDTITFFFDPINGVIPSVGYWVFSNVYPNPSSGTFQIKCSEKISRLWIMDAYGEQIWEIHDIGAGMSIEFGRDLTEGLYTLIVEYASDRIEMKKLVKIK